MIKKRSWKHHGVLIYRDGIKEMTWKRSWKHHIYSSIDRGYKRDGVKDLQSSWESWKYKNLNKLKGNILGWVNKII